MQPNEENTKPRKRRKKGHSSSLHEGEGEGWAVSYSDLLMVLMSFFIVFYNADPSSGKESGLDKFIKTLKISEVDEASEGKEGAGEAQKEGDGSNKSSLGRKIASFFGGDKGGQGEYAGVGDGELLGQLKGRDGEITGVTFSYIAPEKEEKEGKWNKILKKTDDKNSYKGGVMIDFPDNLYGIGGFELNKSAQKELKRVLDMIRPYQKDLNVVIIGHSDSIPVKSKRKIVNSNLILSSLRAAKAVEFAVRSGLDPLWVSSQGLSKYTRNTRSLSIRLMER